MRSLSFIGRAFVCGAAALFGTTALAAGGGDAADAPAAQSPVEEATALPHAERPGSAWDVLRSGGKHRRFLELAAQVGLHRVLDGEHAVTVFAPSDAAFDVLSEEELQRLLSPEGRSDLRELVAGHLMWGETRSTDVSGVMMRPTLPGFTVVLRGESEPVDDDHEADPAHHAHAPHIHGADCDHDAAKGALTVADVAVVECDVWAQNGVVHHVEALIRRPEGLGTPHDELKHAPACEDKPDHAREHARMAEAERRRGARRSGDEGGGASGGADGGLNASRSAEDKVVGPERPAARPGSGGGARPGGGGGAQANGGAGGGNGGGGSGGGGGGCGCGGG